MLSLPFCLYSYSRFIDISLVISEFTHTHIMAFLIGITEVCENETSIWFLHIRIEKSLGINDRKQKSFISELGPIAQKYDSFFSK